MGTLGLNNFCFLLIARSAISNVKVGDMVITETGSPLSVAEVFVRDIYSVCPVAVVNGVTLTPGHPVLYVYCFAH